MTKKKTAGRAGRPPKFREPHHPVTMTLPKRILDQLARIDPDRARAVVKVTEAVFGTDGGSFPPVELVKAAPGESMIIVGPSRALERIPWLKRIEIAPARYLLSVPPGTPIEALEVVLRDLLQDPGLAENEREKSILQELVNLIGQQRRSMRLSKEEILIIGPT